MPDALRRFAEKRRLACIAVFACAGCFISANAGIAAVVYVIIAAVILPFCFLKRNERYRTACIMLCVLFIAAAYRGLADIRPAVMTEGKHDVEAVICDFPIEQQDKHRTVITLDDAVIDGEAFPHKIRMYVYDCDVKYSYGQKLLISQTKLTVADGVTNPGGFDFNAYLWRSGTALCGSSQDDRITVLGKQNSIKGILYSTREELCNTADMVFGNQSDVMKAILFGDRSELSDETYEDFSRTGIAHLIALSGLHVSCIAMMLHFILRRTGLHRYAVDAIVSAVLLLYMVMTGSSPSTVRAVIMYLLYCFTSDIGYPSDTLTRLAAAFIIQIAINPLITGDTGFMLSYAALFGILCLSDVFENVMNIRFSARLGQTVKGIGISSLCVQTAAFPLMAEAFTTMPLLSVPANILLVPFAIAALYAGAVCMAMALISIKAAAVCAIPVKTVWVFIKSTTKWIAAGDFTSFSAVSWPVMLTVLFIAAVFCISPYLMKSMKRRRVCLGFLLILILIKSVIPVFASDDLKLTFIDVGYGDSTLVEAQGRTYLIDCGKDNGIAADYVSYCGFRLSGVFITHPDSDHAGGLKDVLDRNSYAKVYLPDAWDKMNVPETLAGLIEDREIIYLSKGDTVRISPNIIAEVLWPPQDYNPVDDNDGSLVLRLVYGESTALFMADISDATDINCCAPSKVLKVSHHGSKYATSRAMLSVVKPEVSVISVSSNGFGHPTAETIGRLEETGSIILRTDFCGATEIEMFTDGCYTVSAFIEQEEGV